jgi:polysaccharide biosynthesis/export protein
LSHSVQNVQWRRKRRWKEQKMLKCLRQKINRAAVALVLLAGWAAQAGGQTQDATGAATSAAPTATATDNSSSMVLREGETIKIAFPGAPSLDSAQTIRVDGKITLSMVGEIKAAGLTPKELEAELLKAYGPQLVVKEVSVTVQSAVFEIYVTGAVLRPGKVISDRVETPLEAVIEAGLDHNKANLKKVMVIREGENGKTEHFKLNLDDVLKGKPTKPFILKPMDKIFVPEKFMWY